MFHWRMHTVYTIVGVCFAIPATVTSRKLAMLGCESYGVFLVPGEEEFWLPPNLQALQPVVVKVGSSAVTVLRQLR